MSFDLGFWHQEATSRSPEDIYEKLLEGRPGVIGEAETRIDALYQDIVSAYPEADDDEVDADEDDSPWGSGLYHNAECLLASISWSRTDEVVPILLGLARKHGLVAYDPQKQVLHI